MPAVGSPFASPISGLRPARLRPSHPATEILTGTTWPFWTRLSLPTCNGGNQFPLYACTGFESVAAADVPPSLSVTVALTFCGPQAENFVTKELFLSVSVEVPPLHCQVNGLSKRPAGSLCVPVKVTSWFVRTCAGPERLSILGATLLTATSLEAVADVAWPSSVTCALTPTWVGGIPPSRKRHSKLPLPSLLITGVPSTTPLSDAPQLGEPEAKLKEV